MIKKVHIFEDCGNLQQCQRCKDSTDTDGWFCTDCNDFIEVDFDVEDPITDRFGNITGKTINRKGEIVCPWCYNQLVDIYNATVKKNE